MQTPPTFQPVLGLARLAGVSRTLVYRLMATGELAPDAYVAERGVQMPVFLPERAVVVVRAQRRPSKIQNLGSERVQSIAP